MKVFYCLKLADLYEKSGEFTDAERIYQLAYQTVKDQKPNPSKSRFNDFSGTAYDGYDRLGYFYLQTGNLRKAEEIFNESKTARDAAFPKRSVHRIQPIVGMGSLNYRRGEYAKTIELFEEATRKLGRATTTWYDYDNINRLFLKDLSELCLMQGRNAEALDYINKLSVASSGIVKFGTRIGARTEIARVFELKARYFLLEGDFDKAQDYLERANQYYSSKVSSSDVHFKIQKTQALLYWYQGNLEKASESFLSLVAEYRQHIRQNFVSMSEYEKEQFYNTLKSDFSLFNAYATELSGSGQSKLFEEIYNNTLNTKALLLNETNRIKNSIIASGNQELAEKLHNWDCRKSYLSV